MAKIKRFRIDHQWSKSSFKRSVATAGHVIALIGLVCLPLIRFTFLILTFVLLNISLRIRRCYVQLLAIVFDYATKIKKDKEFVIEINPKMIESSSLISEHENHKASDVTIDYQSETSVIETNSRRTRSSSIDDIQFNLDDIIDCARQGLQAIVDDEVTKRFTAADEMAVWNLLTRTQQQQESFSVRVTSLWFIGFLIRYCILFPYRLALFFLAIVWVTLSILFFKYAPIEDAKLRYGFYTNMILHRILSRVFSAIVTYHNTEYRPKRGSICVANHTSPIDVIILSTDNSYSMIGQRHGGFFGLVQQCLSLTANHIWFERSQSKDRQMVLEQMRKHIQNEENLPILIFPEGTCINNTSVMMFKKGSFEISEATIYPVAIKYDNRFGDAFWNSARHQLYQYLILMMTSWAIVVDVYYLPPMKMQSNESPVDFACRVKSVIAKQGGFVNLEWDGGLKRTLPKADYKAEQQRKFYQLLKSE